MAKLHNPVLPGFNPDPSFLRVGDDFYLATSTFEWFPGVPLYHSKDLVHWRLIGHALTEKRTLDLTGVPDSGGIWAPSLSYHQGQFWLIYTIVRQCGMGRPFKDLHNYLITAPSILGPWSDPIYLNASGFDASLFHDDDGRKWLAGIQWDFRNGKPRFAGIILQEYDHAERRLVGAIETILTSNELIEGPNLYKKDGWYYLMVAQGGTGSNHGVAMARSREIWGPYENDPQFSLMTSRHDLDLPLQQAGHGELMCTESGEWYMAHLCTRPQRDSQGKALGSVRGRETAIQRVVWNEDGWLRLEQGGVEAAVEVTAPHGLKAHPWPAEPERDDFDEDELGPAWSSLRVPFDGSWITTRERRGWLRLRGRESMHSPFEQSLAAKRIIEIPGRAETCLDFDPTHFTQMAGLIGYFDLKNHFYLRVTHDETRGKILGLVLTDDGKYLELTETDIEVNDWPLVYLRAEYGGNALRFSASPDGSNWLLIGPELELHKLSDGYGSALQFTGTMIGICAQDLGGTQRTADFDYFELR